MLQASSSWLGQSRIMSRRKGLSNEIGENNCFLNVIIQSLWHLRACRVLITTGDHALHHRFGGQETKAAASNAARGACLLCELEQIFIMYQFAEEPVLDVDRVRVALGSMFQIGAMNDATETLEAILDALHWDTFNRMLTLRRGTQVLSKDEMSASTIEDAAAIVCEPQCIAHLLFQMNLMELQSCRQCGETNEPLMNTDFLYRVYAQELLHVATTKTLEDVLRLEAQGGCVAPEFAPSCDACKGGKMRLSRWILQLPMVFATSIIWASDHVEKSGVKGWLELLTTQNARAKKGSDDQQTIDLSKVFHVDQTSQGSAEYVFRGMVCYYGRHYVGFFKSRTVENGKSQERWFLFDDTRVKLIGSWDEVRSRVERGVYQPTILFYERKGIEQTKLEKVANEIHQWWKESAEGNGATANGNEVTPKENEATTKASPDAVATGATMVAMPSKENGRASFEPSAPPEPTIVHSPPPRTNTASLPMSPIKTSPRSPTLPPFSSLNGDHKWHDDHLSMLHQSAKDTLSRLNGILSREVKPASKGSNDLRMSVSLPRSVRRREYSVHDVSEAEDDVDRDKIFEDNVERSPRAAPPSSFGAIDVNGAASSLDQLSSGVRNLQVHDQQNSSDGKEVLTPSQIFDVVLSASDGGLGIALEEPTDGDSTARSFAVSAFELNGAGEKLTAEASDAIQVGDRLLGINGEVFVNETKYEVLEKLLMAPNPVTLTFQRFLPWACPRCTLHNEVTTSTCAACGLDVFLQKFELQDERTKRKLRWLESTESLAVLHESLLDDSTDDGLAPHRHRVQNSAPIVLDVSLHRGRLALLVGLIAALLIPLTVWLACGTELERFDRENVTPKDHDQLLDKYNSYSGGVAWALGRPLELSVGILAPALVLVFMTKSVLADESKQHTVVVVAVLGAGLGVLLTNGLNSLNVQVRELPVNMVLSAATSAPS